MYDVTSKLYNPALSLKGALENMEKDYDSILQLSLNDGA